MTNFMENTSPSMPSKSLFQDFLSKTHDQNFNNYHQNSHKGRGETRKNVHVVGMKCPDLLQPRFYEFIN